MIEARRDPTGEEKVSEATSVGFVADDPGGAHKGGPKVSQRIHHGAGEDEAEAEAEAEVGLAGACPWSAPNRRISAILAVKGAQSSPAPAIAAHRASTSSMSTAQGPAAERLDDPYYAAALASYAPQAWRSAANASPV